ncbi:hypothetical protein JNUCC0626_20045 [Lentzea sp. JNUCC 0626]|uniref:hypothetical protein n=1 Tax=Lentzea sp. JNUCC 0626 TaxID=3367513 RepID=UPI0037498151
MPKVIIAFDRDNSRVGKTVDLDEDAARVAVAEGRARYVHATDAVTVSAPTDQPPTPSPAPVDGVGKAGR